MANEAVLVEGEGGVQDFTVASGAAIPKFTLCKLSDARLAAASSAEDVFAGIAATAKSGTDFSTELGLWTEGTFKLTSAIGAVITAGMQVSLSGANLIKQAETAELLTGRAFGKALESIASNTTGEVRLGW